MISDKPRICFFGHVVYRTPLNPTEEKRLRTLSELAEVHVIAFSGSLKPRILRGRATLLLIPRLRTAALKFLAQATLGYAALMALIIKGRAEVVIAQSPVDGFACALAKRTAALFGKRVALVIENHGDYLESIFLQRELRLRRLRRWFIGEVARFSAGQADALRAVSRETQQQLRRLAGEKPAIRFIAWTDIEVFSEAYRGIAEAERSRELICFVGAVIPGKGVENLIKAFAKVSDRFEGASLEIIGPRPNRRYFFELKRRLEDLGLEKRVSFIGELPQGELAARLARARALALPSLSEGLGRVILEAMACGVPAICSDVGGIRDIVEDGKTGYLVPPGGVEELSGKMGLLLENRDMAVRMGEEARSRASSLFSPSIYEEGYRKLITAAIEEARKAAP